MFVRWTFNSIFYWKDPAQPVTGETKEMTRHFLFLLSICTATANLLSCSHNLPDVNKRIVFSVNDFLDPDPERYETKSSLKDGSLFVWSERDTVGIYPDSGGQVYFGMSAGAGTNNASFDGGGWEFKSSSTYYSYYPFIGDIYLNRNHIPVSYLGQHQPTATDTEHIGPYDYMVTPGVTSENGGLMFNYSHLNCLIRVTATLPAGTYTKMTITSPDEDFVTKGYYDLMTSNPVIIPEEKSYKLSIALDNITLDSESRLVVYMMSAPVNLMGKEIIVSFNTATATIYSQTKIPSRYYAAESIGGLTCADMVRTGDFVNGVGVDDYHMEDDDELIIINQ